MTQLIVVILFIILISVKCEQNFQENYEKYINCLNMNPKFSQKLNNLHYPKDARTHYQYLLNETQIFRNIPYHKAGSNDYFGPWIENYYITHFIDKPFEYFNGIIPLFIQWTDIHVHSLPNFSNYTNIISYSYLIKRISELLRNDVIYLAVTQDDQGLGHTLTELFPNILSMSAGGYGHIPIPLIKDELAYVMPPNKFNYSVGFHGHKFFGRGRILNELKPCLHRLHIKYIFEQSNHWLQYIKNTKFNLAPRGFGRTSYRLAEIIQLGRIPVHIYDDIAWLPYQNTNISLNNYGYIIKTTNILQLCEIIYKETDETIQYKLNQVAIMRDYYTYKGLLKQIEMFLENPFGNNNGNYLRCIALPEKEH